MIRHLGLNMIKMIINYILSPFKSFYRYIFVIMYSTDSGNNSRTPGIQKKKI